MTDKRRDGRRTDKVPVSHLEAEIAWLRGELEARRREVQELHVLLAQRALPAPNAATPEAMSGDSRPWWRRWLVWP